jgi:hypothetical protein
VSNEDDVLEEFLGIVKKDAAPAAPTTTTTDDAAKAEAAKVADKLG